MDMKVDKSGEYQCPKCKEHLLTIASESQLKKLPFIVACLVIGTFGVFGYERFENNKIQDNHYFNQSKTKWTSSQISQLELKCRATFAQDNLNWSSEKVYKSCSCIVEKITSKNFSSERDYPNHIDKESIEQCVR